MHLELRFYLTIYPDALRVYPGGMFWQQGYKFDDVSLPRILTKEGDYLGVQVPNTYALLMGGRFD